MIKIAEDHVSFETAKLLKEKGFEGRIHTFYTEEGTDIESSYVVPSNFFPIYRPTLQMAMKWLREIHKIYMYVAHDSMENTWFARVYNDYKTLSDVDNYSTYEEAAESAIKYCLENLI